MRSYRACGGVIRCSRSISELSCVQTDVAIHLPGKQAHKMHKKNAGAEQSGPGTGGGNFPKPLQCRKWPLSANGDRGLGNLYTRTGEGGDTGHTSSSQEEGDQDKPCCSGGEEGKNTGGEGDASAPPSPAGPLIPKRHLKQCAIGTMVLSAVVLASVALVISARRPGHKTVVIHVTNSSGIADVAVHLKDDVQKATDDVSNERLGTRLGLKDSSEKVQKRAELREFPTTPGFSQQVSPGPQASPATNLLTKINTSLPRPPPQPLVTIDPAVTTLGESGKPRSFTVAVNPPKISPQVDPVPQQYTTPPKPFEQHALDTTPHPNAKSQTPFNTRINPATSMHYFTPNPPMAPTVPPTTTTAAPSVSMLPADVMNFTCQHKIELWAGTGSFSSPEYPEKYPPNLCITWHISTDPDNCITITFENFSVEENVVCKYDKVWVVTNGNKLYGPMCTSELARRRRRGRKVQLTFLSDGSFQRTGFKVHYSSQPWGGPGCG